jgi:Mg2+/Co2+ transporter CorB
MLLTLGAIVFLLLLSAFFSAAETSLTVASRPAMHQMEHKGNWRARLVNRLNARQGQLIGSILIANNLVNILASAIATSVLIAMFGEAGVAYATAVMTVLIVVFGEILPKSYALRNSDRAALFVAPIIRPVVRFLAPVTWATDHIVRATMRLFGIKVGREEAIIPSSEELRGAIELHQADAGGEDEVVAQERAMLRSVLDLSQVEVGEIMVHRRTVVRLNADDTPETILEQVLNSPHTRLPLWRGEPDNIIGIVHVRDILKALRTAGGQTTDIDIEALASKPWFVPETTTLLDQLHAFRARHEHFALVIDEYGSLLGVVTLEDIIEEIVGDISDEFDVTRAGLRPQTDGSIIVDGQYTIRDLNRQMHWRLPDEHASTIAGLVLHAARRIPDVGQAFRFHGMRFEILRRQRHQITLIRITPPQEAQDAVDDDQTG